MTVIVIGPTGGLVPLVLMRLALLLYVAQLVEVVAAVTWTKRLWPGAERDRLAREAQHLAARGAREAEARRLARRPSMTQVTGVAALPPGRLSASLTPVALPTPVLLSVTV